jgi:outer membrane protein TolC
MTALILSGCASYHPRPISAEKTAASFQARSLTNPHLRAFLQSNHVAVPGPQDVWNLKALTLVAFYYQPSLAEARAQLATAQAASITAGERPNPSLSITPGFDSGIPGNPSPWLVPVSVDWPIETAGKRGRRIAQAVHLAEAARWRLVGTVWRVRSRLRTALLDLYAARETRVSLTRQAAARGRVVHLLEGQEKAGNASGFEVTQAQVQLDTTRMALQAAVGRYRQERVRLANALGVPKHALAGIRFSFAQLKRLPRDIMESEVRRRALLDRADVREALAQYAASQSALQLEIAGQYPDLHLGPGYAWNAGNAADSEWDLGFTLTLPVLNQNQGPIAEASARRAQAAAHFLAVQANVIGQIDSAMAAYRAALKQSAAAESLLHHLRRRLDSVRIREQAGETAPLAAASAEVAFDAGSQRLLNASIQAQQAVGRLEEAVQSPLTLPSATIRAAEKTTESR